MTDARSIPDSDIVTVDLIFPDHKAQSLEVRPGSDPEKPHRWYYKHQQQPDDLLAFIQVDTSRRDGVPKRCPHAAFKVSFTKSHVEMSTDGREGSVLGRGEGGKED